jgi:hypothetical protein
MGRASETASAWLADARRDEPLWVLLLVGWLATETVLDRRRAQPTAATAALEQFSDRPARPDPTRAPPRELRRLPGIGEARALAIARARWERGADGGELRLEDVPGIGPLTARNVERFLADQGWDPAGVASPALDEEGDEESSGVEREGEQALNDGRDSRSDTARRSGAADPTLHSSPQPARSP